MKQSKRSLKKVTSLLLALLMVLSLLPAGAMAAVGEYDHKVIYQNEPSTVTPENMPMDFEAFRQGVNFTLPTAPTAKGYIFKAWKVEMPGETLTAAPLDSFVMPEGDVTITALWEPETYSMFYSWGDSEAVGLEAKYPDAVVGTAYDLPVEDPVLLAKYQSGEEVPFAGWLCVVDGEHNYTVMQTGSQHTMTAADATFAATWGVEYGKLPQGEYPLVTNYNDGGLTPIKVEYKPQHEEGDRTRDTVTLPDTSEEPTREGYIFTGWDVTMSQTFIQETEVGIKVNNDVYHAFNQNDGSAEPDGAKAGNIVNVDYVVFTAHWEPNIYTITLNSGDVPSKQITVATASNLGDKRDNKTGEKITLPTLEAKPGAAAWKNAVFMGWELTGDVEGTFAPGDTIINETGENIYATAIWTLPLAVTYDTAPGTGEVTDNVKYKAGEEGVAVKAGDNITAPEGQRFVCWTDAAGNEYVPGEDTLSFELEDIELEDIELKGIELKAKYVNIYNVTYKANGGTGADFIDPKVHDEGEGATVLSDTVTKINAPAKKYFESWNTAADGSGKKYMPGATTAAMTEDIVLYAQWAFSPKAKYTVTYDATQGTNPPVDANSPYYEESTVTVLGGEGMTAPKGKVFAGWVNSNSKSFSAGEKFIITSDVKMLAVWEDEDVKFTLSYNSNGGTGTVTDSDSPYTVGSTAAVLDAAALTAPADKEFDSWNTAADGTGTSYMPGGSIVINKDTVLYAQWKDVPVQAEEYTVTYLANSGTGTVTDANSPYEAGATVTVLGAAGLTAPKDMYFKGWNTAADGTGTAYAEGASFTINADTELYAQWKEVTVFPPELEAGDHYAYLIGYPDGTIMPHKNIIREEAATIFFRLLTEDSRTNYLKAENSFSDVQVSRWSNKAVSTMANAGIVNGYPDGSFLPGKGITRAEFATMAVRFAGDKGGTEKVSFSDTANHWAIKNIESAASLGWIKGSNGKFRPDDYITRAEVATIVNRMLEREVENVEDMLEDMNVFSDNINVRAWYYYDLQEAANSHDYERKVSDKLPEKWTEMKTDPDWKAIEAPDKA